MENTGFILDILSALATTPKQLFVKWEETLKKDTVNLGDCKKYNELDVIPRKHKSTDFFCEIPQTKRGKPPPGKMKTCFIPNKTRQSCALKVPSKTNEHAKFFDRRYKYFWGIGHIEFVDPHGIIE
jgi:hypothetical protein